MRRGYLADYFLHRHLNNTVQWGGPQLNKVFRLIELHEWNFLFAIGAILAFIALEFLVPVKEVGEVEKNQVVKVMRSSIRNSLKDAFVIGQLIGWHEQLWGFIRKRTFRESSQSPLPSGSSRTGNFLRIFVIHQRKGGIHEIYRSFMDTFGWYRLAGVCSIKISADISQEVSRYIGRLFLFAGRSNYNSQLLS